MWPQLPPAHRLPSRSRKFLHSSSPPPIEIAHHTSGIAANAPCHRLQATRITGLVRPVLSQTLSEVSFQSSFVASHFIWLSASALTVARRTRVAAFVYLIRSTLTTTLRPDPEYHRLQQRGITRSNRWRYCGHIHCQQAALTSRCRTCSPASESGTSTHHNLQNS